ncbi:SHQ1-domain-containing protein [Hesseltinella vesiculosa]|uniref:SHQ1-domain-containing protein n=1 Tax=Hesseltinella vesiculosa TaxID=101127 RepID=A0A1X2GJQ1_9FUNG|nr:SHQ1-domain-containing protein [Hesseltinella vesiculosa]
MITPTFKVEQDDNSVTVIINTPYVRAQDVDLHVHDNEFRFFLKPYFLRLYFPGRIVEDDDADAKYDPSSGEFTVRVSKENKGEHFADLDLLTKLLARRGESEAAQLTPKKPLIEVLSSESFDGSDDAPSKEELQEAENFNWELPQQVPADDEPILLHSSHYGFNAQYQGFFTHVHETANDINDIQEPEKSTVESRKAARRDLENEKFDEDHYCMDFIQQGDIQYILDYKTLAAKELKRVQRLAKAAPKPLIQEYDAVNDINMDALSIQDPNESLLKFTEQEQKQMLALPKKEYLLSNEKDTYLGLVDLLFAYCYNHRTSEGENTVESVWCIGKLSATLSCLEVFSTLKDVIVTGFRRSLAYPLYRNWALCEKVLLDVYILFKLGKRAILKALLEMKDLFDHHDIYYIYSKIYLDDYCTWIQNANDHVLRTLAHELHHLKLNKEEAQWDLQELEEIAHQMQEMEHQGESLE